jgi:hypothetical protein
LWADNPNAGYQANSGQSTSQTQSQVASQYQNHDVLGTLVIACTCTHKNAQLLAPLIIDVDKAIRCWNAVYPGDMINPNNRGNMMALLRNANTPNEAYMSIISGATYGSSFVGMVHLLKSEATVSSEDMEATMSAVQAQTLQYMALSNMTGGIGIDSSFSSDVKSLLSAQQITSHCSMVTMGVIPSIKSNDVQVGVKQLVDDNAATVGKLIAAQQGMQSAQQTLNSQAEAARTGAQMVSMTNSTATAVIGALGPLDEANNKMIDIGSLFTAFEDYVGKICGGGTDIIGVPINYYLKNITKSQIAQLWILKYYPQFLVSGGDDSDTSGAEKQKKEWGRV